MTCLHGPQAPAKISHRVLLYNHTTSTRQCAHLAATLRVPLVGWHNLHTAQQCPPPPGFVRAIHKPCGNADTTHNSWTDEVSHRNWYVRTGRRRSSEMVCDGGGGGASDGDGGGVPLDDDDAADQFW